MRCVLFLPVIPFLFSCTLYQSEGRVALEKNKNGIITATGLNIQNSIEYTCYKAAAAPVELNGPAYVLETSYESQGFSSYLIREESAAYVLIYEALKEEANEEHRFCRAKFLKPESTDLISEAIDLAVFQLLDPDARP